MVQCLIPGRYLVGLGFAAERPFELVGIDKCKVLGPFFLKDCDGIYSPDAYTLDHTNGHACLRRNDRDMRPIPLEPGHSGNLMSYEDRPPRSSEERHGSEGTRAM